jgi:hypothetical protein
VELLSINAETEMEVSIVESEVLINH